MLYTGLLGDLSEPIIESILNHSGFKVIGSFHPGKGIHRHEYYSLGNIPEISKEVLFEKSDVLFFQNADITALGLISEALKRSRHIMLIDAGQLTGEAISELIKLREEAQTVFRIKQSGRYSPLMRAALPLIIHPSLMEIKLMQPTVNDQCTEGALNNTPFKMIDTLLFLCPLNIKRIQTLHHPSGFSSGILSYRIEFDNGSVANLLSTNISQTDSFTVDIYQQNRQLRIDLTGNKLTCTDRSGADNKIRTETFEFNSLNDKAFSNELEALYQSVLSNDASGKELYEISRIAELRLKIIQKSGYTEVT